MPDIQGTTVSKSALAFGWRESWLEQPLSNVGLADPRSGTASWHNLLWGMAPQCILEEGKNLGGGESWAAFYSLEAR